MRLVLLIVVLLSVRPECGLAKADAHYATAQASRGASVYTRYAPITYQVNGEQYVAVAARGNSQLTYPYGDTVAIFKLPSTIAADR
jgi:hypothetical protein